MFYLYFFYPFAKMSDNGEEYCSLEDPFLFDRDNLPLLFQGNFTAEILDDGRLVKIRFDTGEFRITQTGHDENLNHVFQIKFFEGDNQTCLFWGLLEMEYEGDIKYFCVTSHDFSSKKGINALRQILPEGNIYQNVLSGDHNDPVCNLGDRFADVAGDASDGDASDDDAFADETPRQF